ncbi:ABC transporter ATP-binding protein, partial [Cylindrospermopsis raciborskii CS-506_D]|nr:ABC transporter ATP-binding protein [Cylindrospermopsis raciborskii CS-506_D]
LRGSGMALVVVDQNLDTVFNVADEVAVMSRGAIVAQGPSADVRADQALLNHYLGV